MEKRQELTWAIALGVIGAAIAVLLWALDRMHIDFPFWVYVAAATASAGCILVATAMLIRLGVSKLRARNNAAEDRPISGNWPLRKLFAYLAPHLPLTAHRKTPSGGIVGDVDERWKPIGNRVLKELSVGRLHAIGREIIGTKRLHAAPIPSDFWTEADFTYWFLDDGPSVWDAGNVRSFAEVEVNAAEAMAIWPEDVPLIETATDAHDRLRHCDISVAAEAWADSEDDILIAYANVLAKPENKKPLVTLWGRMPPARGIEPIDLSPYGGFDFHVENGAMILRERHGKRRIVDLSVKRAELAPAIDRLARQEV
jgi:hypothetical protein